MKKKIILIILLFCTTAFAFNASDIKWGTDLNSNMASNTLKRWTESVESRLSYATAGTGNIYYVDSGVTNEGDGSSWENARDTLDEAIGLCTANRGDVIYVAQGHNESWDGTDSADVDVNGVTIIGCGIGSLKPRFDYDDTDGELVVAASNVYIYNLAFYPSTSATVHAIEIEADAQDSVIDNCWFMNGEESGDEFTDTIQPEALTERITIVNCVFHSNTASGANTAIDLTAGVNTDWIIADNYFDGDYAEAAVYSDNDVDLRHLISSNVVKNINAGEFAIEFGGNATGTITNNIVITDAPTTAIDPGYMECSGNVFLDYGAHIDSDFGPRWLVTACSDISDAVDMTPEIPDNSILSNILDDGGDTSAYDRRYNSLVAIQSYMELDHLFNAESDDPADDSVLAKLVSKDSTADWSDYDNTTDSLEALGTQLDMFDHFLSVLDADSADILNAAKDSILAKILTKGSEADPNNFNNTTDSLEAISDKITSGTDTLSGIYLDHFLLTLDTTDADILNAAKDSILAKLVSNSAEADPNDYDQTTDSLPAISNQLVYLDHFISVTDGDSVDILNAAKDSILAKLISSSAEADPNDFDNTTDSLEAIGADTDSILADTNDVYDWTERTVYVDATVAHDANDLFDIDGGDILVTNFVGIVIVAIDANAVDCKILIDRDDTAADTELSTAVTITSDVLGTVYVFSNANASVLTPLTPGANGSTTLMTPWFVPEGMLEMDLTAPNLTGTIRWYLTYKPLAKGITVTAQ